MTQELFWIASTVNFILMAVFTIVNIILTKRISTKTNRLNQKTGIDLSVHKDLMLFISDFLNSISDDKVRLISGEEYKENILYVVKNNFSLMKRSYNKLNLFLGYSFTDNENFKILLHSVYEKYCKVYDLLLDALYYDRRCQELGRDENAIELRIKLTGIMNEKYSKYSSLLSDSKIDKEFFDELDCFIESEINYIKQRKI